MNVTVENLAPCKKLVRFEIDAQAVDAAFETVTKDYMRQAALPGFRPGKAPRDMVLKKFEKDIEDGKILMMIDVPVSRVQEIEEMLHKSHPEAIDRGMEPTTPVFP